MSERVVAFKVYEPFGSPPMLQSVEAKRIPTGWKLLDSNAAWRFRTRANFVALSPSDAWQNCRNELTERIRSAEQEIVSARKLLLVVDAQLGRAGEQEPGA